MDRIKVTPAKLRSEAQAFKSAGQKTKSTTDDMFSIISQMTGAIWSGDAQKAYANRFKQLQNDCDEVFKMINEFADDLTDIANNYETTEQQNEDAVKSLSINPII